MTERAASRTAWVPVHPEDGVDWHAMTLEEDTPRDLLSPGWVWSRAIIRVPLAVGEKADKS